VLQGETYIEDGRRNHIYKAGKGGDHDQWRAGNDEPGENVYYSNGKDSFVPSRGEGRKVGKIRETRSGRKKKEITSLGDGNC